MILMGIDLGKARTGVAVSDPGEGFAFPKTVITEYRTEALVQKLAALAVEVRAERLVVGHPRNMDGSYGPRAEECAAIAEQLRQVSGLPTELWDERCTTVSAHAYLNLTDTRGKKRKAVVDAVAAVIILEDYMKARHNRANAEF